MENHSNVSLRFTCFWSQVLVGPGYLSPFRSFWWFWWFRFGHFGAFGGFVSVVSFRCFRFQYMPLSKGDPQPIARGQKFFFLLCRQECFSGKQTTRIKVHTKLHLGLEWGIFNILTDEDIDDVISRFYTVSCLCKNTLVDDKKKNYTVASRYEFCFLIVKNNILLAALIRKILFLPLENKIHIFAPPCK